MSLPGCGFFEIRRVGAHPRAPVKRLDNIWMDTWTWLAVRLFAQRDLTAAFSHFYVEYANVTSPGVVVTPPTFSAADTRAYYDALAADPIRDYLRVPLLGTAVVSASPTYVPVLAAGQGNQVSLAANVVDGVGMHGKPFSGAANSTIYGLALVSATNPLDYTRDVLFSRAYYPTGSQPLKPEGSTLSVTYTATFGVPGP